MTKKTLMILWSLSVSFGGAGTAVCQNQQLAFESKITARHSSVLLKKGDTEQCTSHLLRTPRVEDLEAGLRKAFWNQDKTAAIIVINHHEGTLIIAFVENNHQWTVYDISSVERQNLAKLGMERSRLRSVTTECTHWIARSDDRLQVTLKTSVIDREDKTFSAREHLIIDRATGLQYR